MQACEKANVECEWPAARRRKRTRKEMEEARALAARESQGSAAPPAAGPSSTGTLTQNPTGTPTDPPPKTAAPSHVQAAVATDTATSGPDFASSLADQTEDDYNINDNNNNDFTTSMSNFNWPSGFTPENQPFSLSMPDMTEPTMAQFMSSFATPGGDSLAGIGGSNNNAFAAIAGMGLGSLGAGAGFGLNTSPGTDMRLLNALENQAAYIEGNPAEDKDLELYYYRFVSFGAKPSEGFWGGALPGG